MYGGCTHHRRPSTCTADTTHRAHIRGNTTNSLSIHCRDHWLGHWRPPSHAGARDRHHASTIHLGQPARARMDGREGTHAHAHKACLRPPPRLVRCMGGAPAAGGGRRGRHGRWVAVAQRVDEVVWRPQAGNRRERERHQRGAVGRRRARPQRRSRSARRRRPPP